jgi:hypothetical protein
MAKMAAWVKDLASTDEHGQAVYLLVPDGPTWTGLLRGIRSLASAVFGKTS